MTKNTHGRRGQGPGTRGQGPGVRDQRVRDQRVRGQPVPGPRSLIPGPGNGLVTKVLIALVIALLLPFSSDAKIAVFVDGRILKVEDAFLVDDQIALDLPGGGRMVVPAVRIERVVADEVETSSVNAPDYGDCPVGWSEEVLSPEPPFSSEIRAAARSADVSPRLLATIVWAESNFDPGAVSRAGAKGLTQLMPSAAADHGVDDVFDPAANLRGGAAHLRVQLDRFEDLPLALAAYNAGATTVRRYGGIPPYRETQDYVRRIMKAFCGEE